MPSAQLSSTLDCPANLLNYSVQLTNDTYVIVHLAFSNVLLALN